MKEKLLNKVGPIVEGKDFFGRDREILETWKDIVDGNHILITAPRRIGKSSLVKRLIAEAKAHSWRAVYVDVQDVRDEAGFFKVFAERLLEENASWFNKARRTVLDGLMAMISGLEVELSAGGVGSAKLKWTSQKVNEIKNEIKKLLQDSGDMLIAIDELPYFLARLEKEDDAKERIAHFLHWLRAYRGKDSNKIRWIFCGSIGLDTFTEKHKLSEAMNDVEKYSLGAFDNETATSFLTKLGADNEMALSVDNINAMLNLMGWPLPFFLQAHFKQLHRLIGRKSNLTIADEDIKQAYQNIIKDTAALKTWEERLDEQLNATDAHCCKTLLTGICRTPKGMTRKKLYDLVYPLTNDTAKCENMLAFCLKLLERDGYLICEERYYAFRSPLLRDFWYDLKVK